MWLFTRHGFLSVVKNVASIRNDEQLLVRARVRADLEDLADFIQLWRGSRPTILDTPDHDYPFRLLASRAALSTYMSRHIDELNYPNFKGAVAEDDPARAEVYTDVWSVLRGDATALSVGEGVTTKFDMPLKATPDSEFTFKTDPAESIVFPPGGGSFGGAGASASWDEPLPSNPVEAAAELITRAGGEVDTASVTEAAAACDAPSIPEPSFESSSSPEPDTSSSSSSGETEL
jgi:hypothetical protein